MKKAFLAFAAALLAASPAIAQAPEDLSAAPAADSSFAAASLYEWFEADGDAGQCFDRAHGDIVTPYDRWSQPIRIDTDNRSGGCRFNLAIIDSASQLPGWQATMAFAATGDGGQCGNQGVQDVQVVRAVREVDNGRGVRMDMDDRSGGCRLTFSLRGRGPSLLIYFVADDEGTGQCQRPSSLQIIRPGSSGSILLDTDRRSGGCLLQFRLR